MPGYPLWVKSGLMQCNSVCLLWANSGHRSPIVCSGQWLRLGTRPFTALAKTRRECARLMRWAAALAAEYGVARVQQVTCRLLLCPAVQPACLRFPKFIEFGKSYRNANDARLDSLKPRFFPEAAHGFQPGRLVVGPGGDSQTQ